MARDRLAQRLVSHYVIRMGELIDIEAPGHAARDLRPRLARERIERRQSQLEEQRLRRKPQSSAALLRALDANVIGLRPDGSDGLTIVPRVPSLTV